MNPISPDTLMEYLTSRRMSSLGNAALHFGCTPEQLFEPVYELESAERLRIAASRCAGSCGSCGGCDAAPTRPVLTDKTILISMEKNPAQS